VLYKCARWPPNRVQRLSIHEHACGYIHFCNEISLHVLLAVWPRYNHRHVRIFGRVSPQGETPVIRSYSPHRNSFSCYGAPIPSRNCTKEPLMKYTPLFPRRRTHIMTLLFFLQHPPRLLITPDFCGACWPMTSSRPAEAIPSATKACPLIPGYKVIVRTSHLCVLILALSGTTPTSMYPPQITPSHDQAYQFPAASPTNISAHPEEYSAEPRNGTGPPATLSANYPPENYITSIPQHPSELDNLYFRKMFIELGFGDSQAGDQSRNLPRAVVDNHQLPYHMHHPVAQPNYGH
jgi:hypothetical protein